MIPIDKNYESPGSGDSESEELPPEASVSPLKIPWNLLECFAEVKNPWLTLKGERWQDDRQQILDYWRMEKAHSLIVLPHQGDRLLLPKPTFRPGIGEITWDFPGGRLTDLAQVDQTLIKILEREMAMAPTAILQTRPINLGGWAINSSFSNQKLFGYWAEIDPDYGWDDEAIAFSFQIPQQLPSLLERLTCLQCRALLREWQYLTEIGL